MSSVRTPHFIKHYQKITAAALLAALQFAAPIAAAHPDPHDLEHLPILGADLPLIHPQERHMLKTKHRTKPAAEVKPLPASEEYLLREIVLVENPNEGEENFKLRVAQLAEYLTSEPQRFPALAREMSSGAIRRKGGLLTPVTLNQLEPEQEKAVRDLKPGEISAPVFTQGGAIFFRREELRPQAKVPE